MSTTTINFTMKDLDGIVVPNTDFIISSGRLNTGEIPDVLPADLEFTTDDDGQATVELEVTEAPYYISKQDGTTDTFISYKFFVPFSATPLNAEMLYVDLGKLSEGWNDKSVAALIEAKVVAVNARNQALQLAMVLGTIDGIQDTFDSVTLVGENINDVVTVSDNIASVTLVADSIDNVDVIAPHTDSIDYVAQHLPNVHIVEDAANIVESLGETGGSALVEYDGGTLQDIADRAKTLQDYTALRAYAGRATSVRLTTPGIYGQFYYDASDTTTLDNGGTVLVTTDGRRFKRLFNGDVLLSWFELDADHSVTFAKAIDAATATTNTVIADYRPDGYDIYAGFTVPKFCQVICEADYAARVSNSTLPKFCRLNIFGTSGYAVTLRGHTAFRGFTFYSPNQKYTLSSDSESWNPVSTCIQLGDATDINPVAVSISDIGLIGVTHFADQYASSLTCEQIDIRRIYGAPLVRGVNIHRCTDIPRVEDVHWNLNSYGNLITGDSAAYLRKVAKTATAFKFGRVDCTFFTRVFAYGYKTYVHFARDTYTGDDNNSGGGVFSQCGGDAVHEGFLIERSNLNFGIHLLGGFYTPVVKISGSEQAFVKWINGSTNTTVTLDGVNVFGQTVTALGNATHSGSAASYFVFDASSGINNNAIGSGWFFENTGALASGESAASNKRILLSSSKLAQTPYAVYGDGEVFLKSASTESPTIRFENTSGQFRIRAEGGSLVVYDDAALAIVLSSAGNIDNRRNGGGLILRSVDGVQAPTLTVTNGGGLSLAGRAMLRRVNTIPASPTSAGEIGDVYTDDTHIYFCYATNNWRRVAVGAW